jgi:hypothetical protein
MTESNGHLKPDQISFYDETLKKQIEGSYKYDGKAIHVSSMYVYGARSAPVRLTGFPDHNALKLFAQKVLSELARDAEQKLSKLELDAEKDSATSHRLKKAA